MPIAKQDYWKKQVDINKDPYGKCCINVARRVMEILDENTDKPIVLGYEGEMSTHGLICRADKDVKAGGITGFMAGCVAQIVGHAHSRGQEFRVAWNQKHGVTEEKAKGGTVNPAIVTIGDK